MSSIPEPVFVCHQQHQPAIDSEVTSRIERLGFFGDTLLVRTPPAEILPITESTAQPSDLKRTVTVQCQVRTRIPSEYCEKPHSLLLYSNNVDNEEHLALVFGYQYSAEPGSAFWSRSLEKLVDGETDRDRYIRGAVSLAELRSNSSSNPTQSPNTQEVQPPLARIHSCCFTGETLGSTRCDCREQLIEAMKLMGSEGRGVILYLKQEGRGIGLKDKMKAYNLIDQGYDTQQANIELGHPADGRSYIIATAILRDLQIPSVRLLTNNPHKVNSIVGDGVVVSERVPMVPASWLAGDVEGMKNVEDSNVLDRDEYLMTKVQKMGHILDIPQEILASSRKGSPGMKHASPLDRNGDARKQ
ncbi:GTP cyclohydrolase II-domain-containing protein [Obelidium mucronatum]|nr:GTP cyclohydrolase II-domain-containing protein [Obelidium mucronatum]